MIEIRQIKLNVKDSTDKLNNLIDKALSLKTINFKGNKDYSYKILKKSLDARKKPDLYYIYTVGVSFSDSRLENLVISNNNKKKPKDRVDIIKSEIIRYSFSTDDKLINSLVNDKSFQRPVIIGFGPAGIFCAYLLALKGLRPIIIERGQTVEKRQKSIDEYFSTGVLNTESNVQFGEGGAGTFSDGKLNTLTKDKNGRQGFVLETFVKFGAKENILYDSKPHIGTDILSCVVKNLREEIISLGGTFYFDTKATDIDFDKNGVCGLRTSSTLKKNSDLIELSHIDLMSISTNHLILAIGHSARDTFEMLNNKCISMEPKSFAVGFRVEHPQSMINESQYGTGYPEELEAASYKLANTASNGRRVYSFCMCPGGHVVNASSEENQICVNGMSYSKRDSEHANSAIIIGVDPDDFTEDSEDIFKNPLIGVEFQRSIEKKAFEIGCGKVPFQRFVDFEECFNTVKIHNTESHENEHNSELGLLGQCHSGDLTSILKPDMNEAFIESMHRFGRQIEGFDSERAMMYGVEARTSSPVRILRNESFEASVKGLYPCGEGAGYAGGIMSAAVDGIKVAEAVIMDYISQFDS